MTQTAFPETFMQEHANEASFYYDPKWLQLITKLYGYRFIPLTTTNAQGDVTGFLPLCTISSALTGRRLVALPFSDHCPLIAADSEAANNLVDQALELARKQKVRYLELRTGTNETLAKRTDFVEANLYVRWVLSLTKDPQDTWKDMRKPVQHQIKKSRKMGVQVRIAEKREDMDHYYRLHLLTRSKKHGMPAQPLQFFRGLWDNFAATDGVKLLLAEHEGTVIAGMVLLASGDTVRYAYGASDEKYLNLAPNNLLMWQSIEWGCEHGYKFLDMGRTACENEGLMEYKRRWGAVQQPLPYYYYPATDGLASTSEQSPKFLMLTNAWRKLPVGVSGPLGGYLYRHLG